MKKLHLLLIALAAVVLCSANARAAQTNTFKRKSDVVYGHKMGMALVMDVFQPQKPNGIGVIFVVSGGWFSAYESINPAMYKPFLDRGYTVFAVTHGSQPKFQIPEIMQDMKRSVRFVRANAKKFHIDPDKIGVSGGSAGGHLSLILGTQGDKGKADAKDPLEKTSSEVQAVACFFPPTDFLNYGKEGESALGENILKNFKAAFGELPQEQVAKEKFGKSISPFYFISSNTPPTLLIHGNKDTLVPMQQSEIFVKRAKDLGVDAKLSVKEGGGHGWPDWLADFEQCADWFDSHLRGLKKTESSK